MALLPTVANKESLIAALLSTKQKNVIMIAEIAFLILIMDLQGVYLLHQTAQK